MAKRPRYDVHPGVADMAEWVSTLKAKTGRDLGEWIKHIKKAGPADEARAGDWLKSEYELGTNTAWWLAERAFAKDLSLADDDPDRYLALAPGYVEEQYAGKKAALRPIYERLHALARGLGKDVRICPCKTMVPVYRSNVIAQIKPSTNTRVDVGLCLTVLMKAGRKLPARLIDTGGFKKKDRITHRIPIVIESEVDGFVTEWAETAYGLNA
ncbi:hypothetical protein PHYC_03043 [Phycisphaerales bacterium]|nr:hypothetical protein PHYC_03043 [Phycisphaerales bacterium]